MKNAEKRRVVIVGSGFGGSTAAALIAGAGIEVLLLERGPWRDTVPTRTMNIPERQPFPRGWGLYTSFLRTLNVPYLPGGGITFNRRGLFELFYAKNMEVVCSSSVGGGSHVYSAVHARPPNSHYWDNVAPDLSEDIMKPHYAAFFERMGSATMTPERIPPSHVSKRFADSQIVEIAKPRVEVRVGFLLPRTPGKPERKTDPHGIERFETDYTSGDYGFLGDPSGAKTTLDVAYLAPAMRAGLEVRDLCEVLAIARDREGGTHYRLDYLDHRSGRRISLQADIVVLAAGTMNTVKLLLHSRDRTHTLGEMPALGQRFSANGDVRGLWDLNEKGTDLSVGLPSQGSIKLREGDEPRQALSNNSVPSVDHYPFPAFVRRRLKRSVVIAGMGEDAMDGIIRLHKKSLDIEFEPDNSPVYARIMQGFKTLSDRSGRKVYAFARPATVHPLGGACAGRHPNEAVVDGRGEVFNHPGLFVADAAAMPRSIGVPPTASIAAWGSRVAAGIVERLTGRHSL